MPERFIGAIMTVAAIWLAAIAGQSQQPTQPLDRPTRISGHPNFNGIWQALNSANWNLEGHSAEALKDFWQLGAIRGDSGRAKRHPRRHDSVPA
jgi:hypothetical protein